MTYKHFLFNSKLDLLTKIKLKYKVFKYNIECGKHSEIPLCCILFFLIRNEFIEPNISFLPKFILWKEIKNHKKMDCNVCYMRINGELEKIQVFDDRICNSSYGKLTNLSDIFYSKYNNWLDRIHFKCGYLPCPLCVLLKKKTEIKSCDCSQFATQNSFEIIGKKLRMKKYLKEMNEIKI